MLKHNFVVCFIFIFSSYVNSIYIKNEGVKTKAHHHHIDPQISEHIQNRYNQKYQETKINNDQSGFSDSRNTNNRNLNGQTSDAITTSSSSTSYYQGSSGVYQNNQENINRQQGSFVGENHVTTYLRDCPPNATGQFAYLYDCRRFLNCWKGRGYIQSCAPGTVFNPDTLECDNPKKVICPGLGNPSEKYTEHQSYNLQVPQTIVTSSSSIITNENAIKCPTGFNGIAPHPFDCRKFLNCAHGITHIQNCGPGTAFNPVAQVCDITNNLDCGGSISRITDGRSYNPRTSVISRQYEVKCSPNFSGLQSHPYDCGKFLNCDHGITHIQSCGPGTVFNDVTTVCDFPYKVNCGSRASATTGGSDSSTSSSSVTYYQVRRPVVSGSVQQNFSQDTYHQGNRSLYQDRRYDAESNVQGTNQDSGYSSGTYQGSFQSHGSQYESSRSPHEDRQYTVGYDADSDLQKQTQNNGFGSGYNEGSYHSQGDHHHHHHRGCNHSQHNHNHRHTDDYHSPQYNWTVISSNYPSLNKEYNWTRTVGTQPNWQQNWTRTNIRYPIQGTQGTQVHTTNVYYQPEYSGTTATSTQSWSHQSTGHREPNRNYSTASSTVTHQNVPNTGGINPYGATYPKQPSSFNTGHTTGEQPIYENTQRQEDFGWTNQPQNPNQRNPPNSEPGDYSSELQKSISPTSTSYHIEQATVHRYPQSNYNIPQNISDSDLSSTSTIYYAQPVNEEEIFDNIAGGDIPASDNLRKSHDKPNAFESTSSIHRDVQQTETGYFRPASTYNPLNSPSDSFSAQSSRRNVIVHVDGSSVNSNDGLALPPPSPHLLPPFPNPTSKSTVPTPSDSFSAQSSRGNVIIHVDGSNVNVDHNLTPLPSPHLLPPFPNPTPKPTSDSLIYEGYSSTVPTPLTYMLPPLPDSTTRKPKAIFSDKTSSYYDSNLNIDTSSGSGAPVAAPSISLQPPHLPNITTHSPHILPSVFDSNIAVFNKSSSDYDSNLYGGLLPPYPDTTTIRQPSIHLEPPNVSSSIDTTNSDDSEDSFTSSSSRHNVVVRVNRTNYYTGSNDPPSETYEVDFQNRQTSKSPNVRTFIIYPALKNTTFANFSHTPPIYSPPYSSISHSKDFNSNSGTTKLEYLPPDNQWVHIVNRSIISNPLRENINTDTDKASIDLHNSPTNPVIYDHENHYVRETKVIPLRSQSSSSHQISSSTTPTYSSIYNREYYKQTEPSYKLKDNDDEMSKIPISEAIKALLRPYLNRSGTITEEDVQKVEPFIMKIGKSQPIPADIKIGTGSDSKLSQTRKNEDIEKDYKKTHEKEVEIILAGEQESLSQGMLRDKHNHSIIHHGHGYNHGNWHNHPEFHSREFHRTHPHLKNPFVDNNPHTTPPESETIPAPDLHSSGSSYRPTIPMHRSDRRHDWEGTVGSVDVTNSRGSNEGNFDCRNGKWVKDIEVCDGVNNCGNRMDENYCDHLGYEVRLSNEEGSKHMGRVEVKILGKWGYVCDDKFGMRDADVLCRELGFSLGASEVQGNSYYPPHAEMISQTGDVLFMMDEIDCKGNETSIKECDFKGWGVHDCTADEVVGVVCKIPVMKCPHDYWLCETSRECIPPAFVCDNVADCADQSDENELICNSKIEFRLANGDGKLEGRVEVKYRGVWGTVCDDDFTEIEAQVVCQSLGFFGDANVIKNAYGAGSGPIWLDQVSCLGNETSLDKCNHWNWGEHNCNHTEDVSIRCFTGVRQPKVNNVGVKGRRSGSPIHPDPDSSEEVELFPSKVERSSKILHKHQNCGIFNINATDEFANNQIEMERVVQGRRAKRGHHPWQATIRTRGRSGKSSHWCGAILISEKHLLTAAHCLAGYSKGAYFVRLGDHYANIAEPSEIDVYIENWYIHEQFRKGTHMNNDIAIVTLKNRVRFNDYVHPICLPSKDAAYNEGRVCVISGWGSIQSGISTPANQLRAAKVPIISENICKQDHVYGNTITDGMFCAGYLDESVDACDGDSGGPFVCTENDQETLFGIISWGHHCGYANKPGVYVKIAKYINWIYEKLGVVLDDTVDVR